MKKPMNKISTDEIFFRHEQKHEIIKSRLREFQDVPSSDYFYEIVYCLLTPQSSAVSAEKAVHLLRKHNFSGADIEPEELLHQKDFYIRFHKTKSKHLVALKEQFPEIVQHLLNGSTSIELRTWLVNTVKGLGWKEASHFLRNIGHRDLAILDRHILRNLIRYGVIKRLPKTLTAKRYLAIEKKFLVFAHRIGIPMDELDLLFWSMETGEIRK
jgi:N-glycosylase/DNA lyase